MSNDKSWLDRLKPLLPIAATLTLAFASSVGIYDFSLIFYSVEVSRIVAGSFDMAYVGLAVIEATMYPALRKEAINVSRTACGTAMLMVTLSGLFKLRPELLVDKPLVGDIALALVHGVPLSYLAYKMSRVVLHPGKVSEQEQPQAKDELQEPEVITVHAPLAVARKPRPKVPTMRGKPKVQKRPVQDYITGNFASETRSPFLTDVTDRTREIVKLWNDGLKKAQIAQAVGVSRTTVSNHLSLAYRNGLQVRAE